MGERVLTSNLFLLNRLQDVYRTGKTSAGRDRQAVPGLVTSFQT